MTGTPSDLRFSPLTCEDTPNRNPFDSRHRLHVDLHVSRFGAIRIRSASGYVVAAGPLIPHHVMRRIGSPIVVNLGIAAAILLVTIWAAVIAGTNQRQDYPDNDADLDTWDNGRTTESDRPQE